ncbi:MAG: hypothetical protein HY746_04255, partial [Elusimicrobia bacterium]|nr:hypothetical protein [Elusimicrobiota bacterium]
MTAPTTSESTTITPLLAKDCVCRQSPATSAQADSITSAMILNNEILDADINSAAAIAISKLAASGTLGANVIASSIALNAVQDGSIVGVSGSKVSGNISGNAANITGNLAATQIAAGVMPANVQASSIALSGFYSSDLVRTNLGLAIGTNVQAWDADLDDLADGSLTGSKVGSGVPAANIASGSLGLQVIVSSIAANAVYTDSILDNTVTSAKILDETISSIDIAADAVGNSELQDEISVSTINATATTPYGGINITSNVFVSAGNVGIGTTGPGYPLHVNGNIAMSPVAGANRYFILDNTNTGTGVMLLQ